MSQQDIRDTAFLKMTLAKNMRRKKIPGQQIWGVQFGAYRSLNEARRNALRTHAVVKIGEIATSRIARGRKSSVGARLLKLTHQEAQKICKKQKKKGNECSVLVLAN